MKVTSLLFLKSDKNDRLTQITKDDVGKNKLPSQFLGPFATFQGRSVRDTGGRRRSGLRCAGGATWRPPRVPGPRPPRAPGKRRCARVPLPGCGRPPRAALAAGARPARLCGTCRHSLRRHRLLAAGGAKPPRGRGSPAGPGAAAEAELRWGPAPPLRGPARAEGRTDGCHVQGASRRQAWSLPMSARLHCRGESGNHRGDTWQRHRPRRPVPSPLTCAAPTEKAEGHLTARGHNRPELKAVPPGQTRPCKHGRLEKS